MSPESEILDRLDITKSDKAMLRERLAQSVTSFVAAATSLLQGRDSGSTTSKQLRTLIGLVMDPASQWKQRDTQRLAELVKAYRSAPGKLAIFCADPDTRQWLARSLQVALDFDRRPSHGVYAVRANPALAEAGEIIVVAPGDSVAQGYERSLVFLGNDH
ncbi:hypothetical protein [Corynebacterium kalinowskii]|nr:hypothetical protein [Corynebacterium kalinowskii]